MANPEHLEILKQGVETWNEWRKLHREITVNLSGADLTEMNLSDIRLDGADLTNANLTRTWLPSARLRKANLNGADLTATHLVRADLVGADLGQAKLVHTNFSKADLGSVNLSHTDLTKVDLFEAVLIQTELSHSVLAGLDMSGADMNTANCTGANLAGTKLVLANLAGVNFKGADLTEADLGHANLRQADMTGATLVRANLGGAVLVETLLDRVDLTNSRVYGISVWDASLSGSTQSDLVITRPGEPTITVDNVEVAQFVYLLLNNPKIRDVINTIGKKAVLILGRFTPERKIVLDAIRQELRRLNYVPMMFDFDKPADKDFTETIMILASLSRFIVADITNPKSSPLELQATVPNYMVPFVPIIQEGEKPFSMFKDLYGKFDWVLEPLEYDTVENLIVKFEEAVVNRAQAKHKELMMRKAQNLQTVKLDDL